MGHFDEVKSNPTNSANISKMLMAKFETFFLFYYISQERSPFFLSTSLKFPSVNRENFNQHTALHF